MSLRDLSVEDPKLYPLHLDDHDPHGLQHFQFGDSYLFLTPTKSKPTGPIVQNFDNQLKSLITRAVWESLWLEILVSVPLPPPPPHFLTSPTPSKRIIFPKAFLMTPRTCQGHFKFKLPSKLCNVTFN